MTATAPPIRAVEPAEDATARRALVRLRERGRSRRWRWLRPVLGSLVLALLVSRLGTGPFRAGLAEVSPGLAAAALLTTAFSTACSAWRWRLVAGRLGLAVGRGTAVAACYRSQLLNGTLPGGVAGDVHRGVRHGADADAVGLGLRSVGWERAIGQVVQIGLLLVLLVALPSPLRPPGRVVGGAVGLLVVGCVLMALLARREGRVARALTSDPRRVLGDGRTAVAVVLLSLGAAVGHVTLFVLAVTATDAGVPLHVVPVLALLVLVVAALPVNVAGWG